jgi:hypothetical protein
MNLAIISIINYYYPAVNNFKIEIMFLYFIGMILSFK